MVVVTFWNNSKGRTGQTYSALAIATHMAVEHNYKILLLSTECDDTVSGEAFGANEVSNAAKSILSGNKKRANLDIESGLEGLSKVAAANRLSPEIVPNYTKIVFKKRLEVVTGPHKGQEMDYDKVYESCTDIIKAAKKYYDIVFVDLNHNIKNETTSNIIKISDIVIYNMEQKMSDIDEIRSIRDEQKIFTRRNSLLLVNRYDRKSKYTTKNISRELKEAKEILSIPYSNLYAESVQEGLTADFFLNSRIRKLSDKEDRTGFFMVEVHRAIEAVIYKIQELQMRI